jgi:iduronate 2-sulfatase
MVKLKTYLCFLVFGLSMLSSLLASKKDNKYNILFIISDDLTSTALSCYGNKVSKTPNIDRLAARGTRFTRTYCQTPYCGPSRASMMFGYYPHATKVFGYASGREAVGPNKKSWSQHFMANGYHTARVSKIYHMGVPIGIEEGTDGADDAASWNEKYNSQGPEWKAKGPGETLESNPDGKKPPIGGNNFVVVEAEGDDLVHSDGKTAAKAVELLHQFKDKSKPFFLGVGFVRPHVPFVAPKKYYAPYPYADIVLPEKVKGDWDDIPKWGINYKTSVNMKMDVRRQKKAVGAYYASVAYMDAMVGKVMTALEETGQRENTIVIFTSDHGYHLGEHDFWAKVSLKEESAKTPLIISVPGKEPAVCHSFSELIDLYPTISSLCGLEVPDYLQGQDLSPVFDDPTVHVKKSAWVANRKGTLYREDGWAFISYGKNGSQGMELFDMHADPLQYTNLVNHPEYASVLKRMQQKMARRLTEIQTNDLGLSY